MDINTVRAIIDSDRNRKYKAQMLYDFYLNDTDAIKSWLTKYMTGQEGNDTDVNSSDVKALFTTTTAQLIPKNHKDFVNKILRNICTVYNNGIDRYLVNQKGDLDETQTELLNRLYEQANIEQAQLEWYKQAKLMNVVEVKPVFRNVSDKVEFDIWTPNYFSVWENAESRLYKDLILFETERVLPDASTQAVREVWTKDEHYLMIDDGVMEISVNGKKEFITKWVKEFLEGNPQGINPYGVIPSQELRFRIGDDYYGLGLRSLVENNIWYDIMENNRKLVEIYQGLGIVYMVNMGKSGEVSITPYTAVAVDNIKDGIEPKISSVATQAPLSEMRESLLDEAKSIALMQGLSSQAYETESTPQSGVSKAYDTEERDINLLEDKIILKDFERKLFNIFRKVYNYHTKSDKLDENLEFVCDFIEKSTPLNLTDQLKKWDWEIEKNASNIIDYMISENPDLTDKEARKQLTDNKQIKEEFASQPIADPNQKVEPDDRDTNENP